MEAEGGQSQAPMYWADGRWLRWDGAQWLDATPGVSEHGPDTPAAAPEWAPEVPTELRGIRGLGVDSDGTIVARAFSHSDMFASNGSPGILRLEPDTGRIQFRLDSGAVVFDEPLTNLHSVGVTWFDQTLEIWRGDRRFRVCMIPEGPQYGNNTTARHDTEALHWQQYLQPRVGQPPPGVTVNKPLGAGRIMWGFVLLILVLGGIFLSIGLLGRRGLLPSLVAIGIGLLVVVYFGRRRRRR